MVDIYSAQEWQSARQRALARDKVCQDCGLEEKLHVHHIKPVREFEEPLEAHSLDNLVVLCQYCHPKWEGESTAPNLLDSDTGLKNSELVYDLSRDSIVNLAPDPTAEDVAAFFASNFPAHAHRCGYCYAPLPKTRGEMLRQSKAERDNQSLCPTCGRLPHFWRNFSNGAPDTETMKTRCELMSEGLSKVGLFLNTDAMKAAVEATYPKDRFFGEVEAVSKFAVKMGAKHSESPISDSLYHIPCPEPNPATPL